MTHYPHIFTINRQVLTVHLGYYEEERKTKQTVEVDVRLYFPEAPECARTDRAPFVDYAILVDAMKEASGRTFWLIEYMATELFNILRGMVDEHCAKEIKLWLCLTKVTTPLEGLAGGASYVTTDLPANATFPPAV